jgi:hypothetical protein
VYNLPLSFYFGRRVAAIATDEDLRRAMTEHPRASALVTEAALAGVSDRQGLRVVPLEPLDFRPVMLTAPGYTCPALQSGDVPELPENRLEMRPLPF